MLSFFEFVNLGWGWGWGWGWSDLVGMLDGGGNCDGWDGFSKGEWEILWRVDRGVVVRERFL